MGESPDLLLTKEGQMRRQIGKGSKLNLYRFSLAMEITLCGIVAQRWEILMLSVWKMVLGFSIHKYKCLLDDRDGIQSSWASISVRMLSGLAAL